MSATWSILIVDLTDPDRRVRGRIDGYESYHQADQDRTVLFLSNRAFGTTIGHFTTGAVEPDTNVHLGGAHINQPEAWQTCDAPTWQERLLRIHQRSEVDGNVALGHLANAILPAIGRWRERTEQTDYEVAARAAWEQYVQERTP